MPQTGTKTTVTKDTIVQGLRDIGLMERDLVLAHSSLSSFGEVEGGPDAVIDALLDAVGPEGTVVFPTFTGGSLQKFLVPPDQRRPYTGIVPITARNRGDFVRSHHPLYSICAKGPMAEELCGFNDVRIFPAGAGKFIHLMGERGGKSLLMGVDHNSNSAIHLVEELGDLEYKVQDKPWWSMTIGEFLEEPFEKQAELLKLHNAGNLRYSTVCQFNRLEPCLKRADVIRFGKIGDAEVRLTSIADLIRVGLEAVGKDPWLLRDKIVGM